MFVLVLLQQRFTLVLINQLFTSSPVLASSVLHLVPQPLAPPGSMTNNKLNFKIFSANLKSHFLDTFHLQNKPVFDPLRHHHFNLLTSNPHLKCRPEGMFACFFSIKCKNFAVTQTINGNLNLDSAVSVNGRNPLDISCSLLQNCSLPFSVCFPAGQTNRDYSAISLFATWWQ